MDLQVLLRWFLNMIRNQKFQYRKNRNGLVVHFCKMLQERKIYFTQTGHKVRATYLRQIAQGQRKDLKPLKIISIDFNVKILNDFYSPPKLCNLPLDTLFGKTLSTPNFPYFIEDSHHSRPKHFQSIKKNLQLRLWMQEYFT